jgi:alpha-amylase
MQIQDTFKGLVAGALLALALPAVAGSLAPSDTSVQMFHWRWNDIAQECRDWLGPQGYAAVQISPPSAAQRGVNWYDIYQPVDLTDLNSKMGSAAELRNMVQVCHTAGVRVYADVVINHLAAGSGTATNGAIWDAATLSYPRFSAKHFHPSCDIQRPDYGTPGNRQSVTSCRLSGLPDFETADPYVQQELRTFLNALIDVGIDGFRVDAAKHIAQPELVSIFKGVNTTTKLGNKLWVTQEAIGDGNVDLKSYLAVGTVNEFKFARTLKTLFRKDNDAGIAQIPAIMGTPGQWGGKSGFLDSGDVTVFVNNWDTERKEGSLNASNRTGSVNDTVGTQRYQLANIFMLAWPYGEVQLHSGFNFKVSGEDAPLASPFDAQGRPKINQEWDFIHRWPALSNMVAFRRATAGQGVNDFTQGSLHQLAFNRGSSGFVAINNERAPWALRFKTRLPAGEYCNVVSGVLNAAHTACGGETVKVDADGYVNLTVAPDGGEQTPAVALHIQQRRR